ncbi:MAG: hypothetical protein CMN63_01465 [Sphingobium sp.]|nr:hypothetical protein [Sphingobium sp.]|tara:strand:+ start:2556 stop:3053 length:498 start_codon:yes stop_codon:yes gene_type:complete
MLPSPDDRAEVSVEAILVRYASGGLVQDGIVDGAVFKSVDGRAFRTRPDDAGELSVNELGIFSEDEEADLHEIRRIRAQWMTIRRTGRFAQIAVKDVEACAAEAAVAFGYWSTPLIAAEEQGYEHCEDDPSHAVIFGIPDSEDDSSVALRDMIAMKVSALHPGLI